jgi:hypothetical protein
MAHKCHWPNCGRNVPPAMWGCKAHWFMLPKALRDRIWATYRTGQEVTKTPSAEYVQAAKDVQEWIAQHQRRASKPLAQQLDELEHEEQP